MFRKASKAPAGGASPVTDTAPCQKSLKLRVKQDAITPIRAEVLAEFQRKAALPGFRKGKAPSELIAKQYGKEIQDEALRRVTKQAFEQAAKEHQLKPVGPFEVSKADFTEAEGLLLEATVEVEPTFELAEYKKIPLVRPSDEVTPQDVDEALAKLQDSMAHMAPALPGAAEAGPGPAKEGAAAREAAPAAEATKERQVPPLDDELAKDLGYENLPKLRAHVDAKLREQKRTAQAHALEAALFDELLKRHAFEVPPRMVAHQVERLERDFKVRLLMSGVAEEKVNEEAVKFTADLRTSAMRHVKLGFILDRIASQTSISVAQNELVERLWQLSQRWKKDPAEVRKILDAQQLWPSVVSTIRQEKTVAWLLHEATIEQSAMSPRAT